MSMHTQAQRATVGLYTPEERTRRDATIWTPDEGALAPMQFMDFRTSQGLVLRYLASGEGYDNAALTVVL